MDNIEIAVSAAQRLAADAAAEKSDVAVLAAAAAAVELAGHVLLHHFDRQARVPVDLKRVVEAIHRNDERSVAVMRSLLTQTRPGARWVEDELEGGALPNGEWWVVDPVEGNINHVHGLAEWGVSATLIRDNLPVLTAVYEPVARRLYTAVRGQRAAYINGVPIRPSEKTALDAAIVTTGQAMPGESDVMYRRMGESVTAMLHAALVVRMTVPATFELARVATGHIDGFWQFSNVRSGQAAGALLVSEAGGVVSDIAGAPWTLASDSFLASTPGIHRQLVSALAPIV